MAHGKPNDIDLFPSELEFAVFSDADIKNLSVVKIITGLTFDALGHPLPGGPYDMLMGNQGGRSFEPCTTCFKLQACPGHMGHIQLNSVVYNPFFNQLVLKILQVSCLQCHKIQINQHVLEIMMLQLRLNEAGYIIEAQELEIYKSATVCQSATMLVKQENGDCVHPRIAELIELLARQKSNTCNNTKTSCAIRSAIVHAGLQRPVSKKCIHCSKQLRAVRYFNRKLVYSITAAELKINTPDTKRTTAQNKVVIADESRKHLREIYANYPDLLKLLFPVLQLKRASHNDGTCPTDMFFMDVIPVTPPKTRPFSVLNQEIVESPQTGLYRSIIENNSVLLVVMRYMQDQNQDVPEEAKKVYESSRGSTPYEKLYNAWQSLQTSVDMLLDVSFTRDSTSQGLKQILEKKEGLIRKHMMGKRVNYAARTVITPDPNINVEEVGLPDIFARRLSYPVPVTPWNVAELRKMVTNGPNIYPGANYIEDAKGITTIIPEDSPAKRVSMAKLLLNDPKNGAKIVHRHVINGDVLVLNRQPTLHRVSIMAHKARILQGEKTFRLHYSNCKSYNADFDGDEMNAHFPQNELARSEAYNLLNVASNYLGPKDGTPLGGLIQDQVISGVKLSIRGRFFNREDYQQLVFQGLSHLRGNIKLLPPTIIKPVVLWSGKQILSTIIINLIPEGYDRIMLQSTAKINSKHWYVTKSRLPNCGKALKSWQMCESQVIIRKGELLAGVLDKQQYGATQFGLIHCMYELYGGDISTNLLTAFTKLFTSFLQREGFTLGVQDILVTSEADSKRRKIIKESREVGNAAAAAALGLEEVPPLDILATKVEEAYIKDPKFRIILDRKYKSLLDGYNNDINKIVLPAGLISQFPANNLQLMVMSGAKGSMVNTMQISCLLGQIELEGKRPPLMISGKSLPSFTSFETSPKSSGFIDGRFMTGIQPQDFFFHCMAGREGLIDTAVKTSRSGYLQRCLIKHLEGLTINYDLTVRDSDNSVVQYLYGEDGLDILKSKFMQTDFALKILADNAGVLLRPHELKTIKDTESLSKITRHVKKIRSWHKKNSNPSKRRISSFTHFSAELRNEVEVENSSEINPDTGRSRLDEGILKLWAKANPESKALYNKKHSHCPDPTTSVYKQDCCYGSISERSEQLAYEFKCPTDIQSSMLDMMYIKNMKSLAAPGEAVGLLAAQSIGEPSTQMTLNTFHFAGRGEMNVTLGIPRLREILMLASSNIKTPSMDIPILAGQEKCAEKLRVKLNRVTIADLLESVDVKIKLVLQPERAYQYQLRFKFLPREAYREDFGVHPKFILKYMSETYFKQLFGAIIKTARKKRSVIETDENKNSNLNDDALDDESDDDNDRASGSKTRKTKTQTESIVNGGDTSEDEPGNEDDNDATGIKLKSRKQDENEYDDPEEVEEIKDANEEEDDEDMLPLNLDDEKDVAEDELDEKIVDKVLANEMVQEYVYDKEQHLWCKLTFNLNLKHKSTDLTSIIRETASKSVVHQVDLIKRAIIYKKPDETQLLKTDGINIVEMFKHNKILDINRLYCNDIHSIAKTYGIEAAANVIITEITNVFKVYGIAVDRRHLSLIADYMTFDGTFQPLSRKGMEHSSSPLQQMSFESCLKFLKSATTTGLADELNSPSSRLMVGMPVRSGTGAFELLTAIA